MEIRKIVNLLNDSDNESSKFATRKWYVINDQNNKEYGERNENDSSIKFETKDFKSSPCDYSDAYILVTGDIAATGGNADINVAFKNCVPFTRCVTQTNDEHIDTAANIDITMPMYNLIVYSDNYSDTSESLWQFKRDELSIAVIYPDVTTINSSSFIYISSFFKRLIHDNIGVFKNVKIAVPLKYLSSF